MTNTSETEPAKAGYAIDIALVIVFALGVIGCLGFARILANVVEEWSGSPRVGDEGIGIALVLFFAFPASALLLIASLLFASYATHLPKAFRVLTILPPVLAILGCFVLVARLMTH